MVLPLRGLTSLETGSYQTVAPALGEVGIRSSLMILSNSRNFFFPPPSIPWSGTVNMRTVQTLGSAHRHRVWVSSADEPAALSPIGIPVVWSFVIHLPGFLRSIGVTRLHRYYETSDFCSAVHAPFCPSSSLCVMCLAFQPFRLQSPDSPHGRLHATPSAMSRPSVYTDQGFATIVEARRKARPNRVRHPTDWLFTSRCSPPRLTATQLRSVTGRSAYT